ncbi:MAG: tRNA (adenosine(37)-N6)-threonylcarbamoyltransferase complex ATPase subunit type 1 TsaE [Myxococcota bacterium]
MPDFCFRSPDAETTHRAARRLGEVLPAEGLAIGLVGALGAGKTAFVKGLGEGLGLDPGLIASPTFVIAGEYPPARPGAPALVHADLYRVESEAELEAAGWFDWLEPGGVLAVEWSDRFPDALPRERLEIRLERGSADGARRVSVRASGPRARACAGSWREALVADGLACPPMES